MIGQSPYFCRRHGEPLRYSLMHLAWRCPEIAVCGTWVSKEHWWSRWRFDPQARVTIEVPPATWDQMMSDLERPPRVNEKMRQAVLKARAREGAGR